MDERVTVLVLGAGGMVGAEVCRLAVAYGAERVVGVTRAARHPEGDPWTRGVEWRAADAADAGAWRDLLEPGTPIVHAALGEADPGASWLAVARAAIANAGARRVVLTSAHDAWPLSGSAWLSATRRGEAEAKAAGVDFVAPRFGLIHGEPRPLEEAAAWLLARAGRQDPGHARWRDALSPTRVERAAMCLLRCALEAERRGPLDLARARYIGDAVMWQ